MPTSTASQASKRDAHALDELQERAEERAVVLKEHRGPTTQAMRHHWRIQREKQQERIH